MADKKQKVPAVVLGVELNGIGVLRSLARAGIPIIAVDDDLSRPGMRSRYGQKYRVRCLHGKGLVDDLVQLGQGLPERPVLFVTQEATVQTVSEYRDSLEPWYRLTLGDKPCIDMLTDKEAFQHFAERHEFCMPKSCHVVDVLTLSRVQGFRFPVIVKPVRRNAAYSHAFKKAYLIENFAELERLCSQIFPVFPDLIVQEWIRGGDSDIYFCLQYICADGEPAASFTGRKIRSWPPQTGGTASCVAAPEVESTLTETTTGFFKAAGFTGMGSMEYKRDSVSGEFYLIEPTVGRTDYQEEVATLNGVNIPLAAWRAEVGIGRPVQAQADGRPPVIWHNASIDRRSADLQNQRYGRGELDSGKMVDGWWRWYDPMPTLVQQWQRIGPAIRKRIKRIGTLAGVKG